MVRKHILAAGRVQGVGFRYICQSYAAKYSLTGWIQNNFDGTVEMEVQGAPHRVEGFIEDVKKGNLFVKVKAMHVEDVVPLRALEEKEFRIRYY